MVTLSGTVIGALGRNRLHIASTGAPELLPGLGQAR